MLYPRLLYLYSEHLMVKSLSKKKTALFIAKKAVIY